MSETLNFTKLADAPVLDEVPDGAKVYAEVEGKVYRVAGDNLGGGGIPTAILDVDLTSSASTQALLNSGAAAVSAGDNSRATSTPVYTATCSNMTYDEVMAIFKAGGQVNARLRIVQDGGNQNVIAEDCASASGGYFSMSGIEACGFVFKSTILQEDNTFLWMPDGTITTDLSALIGG